MTRLADLALDSGSLAAAIGAHDFSRCRATVVGYGAVGREYVKVLKKLGVAHIRVCSRRLEPLRALADAIDVETVAGGFEQLQDQPAPDELAIVSTPIGTLTAAAEHLVALGFRRLLIEKPVALRSGEIEALADRMDARSVDARVAYNRVAYPSVHEVRARAAAEGGITSCTYAFTEIIHADWQEQMPPDVLARWGIANSLHVMSLAHALIGWPATWTAYRSGAIAWHPSGASFVGAGVSRSGIPFGYHADWDSKARWAVEVFTKVAAYRLCPLEQVSRRTAARGEWEPVRVATFDPTIKAGFVEQVAGCLVPAGPLSLALPTLREAAALTAYGEDVFGYQ